VLASLLLSAPARGNSNSQAEPELSPLARIERVLNLGVERSIVSTATAASLRESWKRTPLGELSFEVPLEEGLVRVSARRKELSAQQAKALEQVLRDRKAADSCPDKPAGMDTPEPLSWVTDLVTKIVAAAGLALAVGLLWWIGSLLVKAPRPVQAAAAWTVTVAMWTGASLLLGRGEPTSASGLSIGGSAGSVGALLLTLDLFFKSGGSGRPVAATISALWFVVTLLVPLPAQALLCAGALGIALGLETMVQFGQNFSPTRHSVLVGMGLIAMGYACVLTGFESLRIFIRPFWWVGLAGIFGGFGFEWWSWLPERSGSRFTILLASVLCLAWGLVAPEGTFVGAGACWLIAWFYAQSLRTLWRSLSQAWILILFGSITLAMARLIETHWPIVVRVLQSSACGV